MKQLKTLQFTLKFLVLILIRAEAAGQSISGPTSVCPNTTVRYTFSPSGCTSVQWGNVQGPAPVTIIAQTPGYIDLQFPLTTSSAPFIINAGYICNGQVGNATLNVTLKSVTVASSSSLDIPCSFTGVRTFKYSLPNSYSNPQWTTNTGWPVASGPRITSGEMGIKFSEIDYNVNNTNGGFVKLTVGSNDCPNAAASEHTYNVSRPTSNSLPAPVFSAAPAQICLNTAGTFSVQPYANAISYTWSSDQPTMKINGQTPPVTVSAGNNGNIVTISEANNNYTANITVKAQTTCGQTINAQKAVTVGNASYLSSPQGPTERCVNTFDGPYTISPYPGATSYEWAISPEPAIYSILGNGSTTVDLQIQSPGYYSVYVKAVSNCGYSISSSLYVTVYSPTSPFCRNAGGVAGDYIYYPNPTSNQLIVNYKGATTGGAVKAFEIKLYNNRGEMLKSAKSSAPGKNALLDISKLPNDTYFLHIIDNKTVIKKQVIVRHN